MNDKKNILVFISSGFALRNFLCTDIIRELEKAYKVTLIMPKNYDISTNEKFFKNYKISYSDFIRFPKLYRFLRSIIVKIENKRLGNYDPHFRKWHITISKGKQKFLTTFQYLLSDLLTKNYFYLKLKNLEEKILHNLKADFKTEDNIDLLISTNPFSSFEYPYIFWAKNKRIKNLSIILSWDNLLWMGKVPVESDYYFVWGPVMRKDLKRHFPFFPDDKIVEVGSPQFDFHINSDYIWDCEKFYNYLNVKDRDRKIICYSANTPEHFHSEPFLIEKLMQSLRENRIKYNPYIVLRIHPHDNTDRFNYLKSKHPEIIFSKLNPEMKNTPTWFIPKNEELAFFSNLIRYSSLNINLASTVTLDFAFLNKPVINIAFSPLKEDPLSLRIPHYYSSPHYKKVVEIGATKIVYSMEELEKEINYFLDNPEELSRERKRLIEQLCGGNDDFSKNKIIKGIEKILNEKNSFLH